MWRNGEANPRGKAPQQNTCALQDNVEQHSGAAQSDAIQIEDGERRGATPRVVATTRRNTATKPRRVATPRDTTQRRGVAMQVDATMRRDGTR